MGRRSEPVEGMDRALACIAVLKGQQLVYTYVNPAYQAIAPDLPMVGRPYREVFPEAAANGAEAALLGVLNTGVPWVLEQYLAPTGNRPNPTFEGFVTRLAAEDGKESSVLAIVQEISELVREVRETEATTELAQAEKKLREKSEHLREAERQAEMGIWAWDWATDTVEWSDGLRRIIGYDPQLPAPRFAGMASFYTPESWERLNVASSEALTLGRPYQLELDQIRVNGEIRRTMTRGVARRAPDGTVSGLQGTVQDITSLRRKESEYANLFEKMLDGFAVHEIICDESGKPVDYRFIAVNPAFEVMTGLKAQDIVGHTVLEVMPDTERHWIDTYGAVALIGQPATFENYAAGLNKHFHVTAFRPAPRQFACIFADITQQKLAEAALRQSEERFRAVALHTPDHIIVQDRDLRYELVINPQLGLTEADMIGKTDLDFLRPEDAEKLAATKRRVIKTGEHYELETSLLNREGGAEYFQVIYMPRFDEQGQPNGLIGYFRNITSQRNMEEALRQSEEQLRQSQKMEAIGQLAGGIAHDFNNLLSVIVGYTELLLVNPAFAESPAQNDLNLIKQAAEQAAALTGQILAFSRRQTLRPAVVSLNEIVTQAEPLLRRSLGEDVDLRVDLDPDLSSVEADPSKFQQVITNLALNSRDAMAAGGTVTVRTTNCRIDKAFRPSAATDDIIGPGDYAVLSVSDTGAGMDASTQQRIFEPFFTTKALGKGTGLGLSVVYGLVRQSQGHISVASEPGSGTTVSIYLPRSTLGKKVHGVSPRKVATSKGWETVLLVEDEAGVRELVERVLADAGYAVYSAPSSDEALKLVTTLERPPQLLLTDVVLPGSLQGPDLAREMEVLVPGVSVLYMSGYSHQSMVHAGRLDEGVSLIEKPFTPAELTRAIRELLDGH
jgi:PAS domain S-box-containing protein